jgi:hypothetical protein
MPVSRGAALLIAGLWLGLLVASWVAATASFRGVDRVLGPEIRPELQSRLTPLPIEDRRLVLRHVASEINRWMFRRFGLVQIALAVAFVALAWPASRGARVAALAAAAIVLVQAVLAPSIESLGRAIDFVARPLPPDLGRRFGALHGAFVLLDLLKAGLLLLAGPLLARLPLK